MKTIKNYFKVRKLVKSYKQLAKRMAIVAREFHQWEDITAKNNGCVPSACSYQQYQNNWNEYWQLRRLMLDIKTSYITITRH